MRGEHYTVGIHSQNFAVTSALGICKKGLEPYRRLARDRSPGISSFGWWPVAGLLGEFSLRNLSDSV